MLSIEALRTWGADVDEGLKRCLDDADFYTSLVQTVPEDATFAALQAAIAEGDLDAAFEAAHALKGVLGNLSLKPLYDPMCTVVEALRVREQRDYAPLVQQVEAAREALAAICRG